jgi:hypothetical protein
MTTSPESIADPRSMLWIGRILSSLAIIFLFLDAVMKLIPIQPVTDAMRELGFTSSIELARGLGMLLMGCTMLYAIPRTSLIGALLLTGYLGGAIAIQLRVGNPLLSHTLFGSYIGITLWAGLLCRNQPLRAIFFSGGR